MEPLKFIADFIKYYDTEGIYDMYDKDLNKMVTSPAIEELIKQAREFFPDMSGGKSAKAMRDLTDEEREQAITSSSEVVVDARALFSRKVAANGGRAALMRDLITAVETNNIREIEICKNMLEELDDYDKGIK